MRGSAVSQLLDPDGLPLFSLKDVNALPVGDKERIYRSLVPEEAFSRFGIDPVTGLNSKGERSVRFIAPRGLGLVRIEVRQFPGDRDCIFFAEIADTHYGQIELSFCLINDPGAERFDVDVDAQGRDNCFGTVRRNLAEERRAMEAGLSPHQVRRGLQFFTPFFRRFERFVQGLGGGSIVAEPLSYSNAIRYERYGFDYLTGRQLMLWIDREFQPGGELYRRLDGSTPFRQPGMEKTVRGRSWAIHDGILGRPWDGIRIYKVPGTDAGIDSFPDRAF